MKKLNKTPLAMAMGSAVISSFTMNAQADSNPFALTELASGYMLAQYSNKTNHGACGGNVADANGNKTTNAAKASTNPTGAKSKKAEGSCGEGMCGGMMSGGEMKKGMEGSCGDMMKGKEGSCGMMGGMGNMNHGDSDKAQDHADAQHNESDAHKKVEEHACGAMMKGGEASCGAKVDADKAAGH